METNRTREKVYAIVGPGGVKAPNYERAVRSLTDAELEDEILGKRGDAGYQLALIAEYDRRAKEAT